MNSELFDLLRLRYPSQAYALFREVQSATAYQGRQRADAVAMGLWPSRGLDVIGFEFKMSRADWLRELKDPDKAEEIFQFCDRWYLVAGEPGVVKAGELPSTWGLLVVHGGKLVEEVEAPKLDAKPMAREFVASVLRRAQQEAQAAEENRAQNKRDADQDAFFRAACINPSDWASTNSADIARASAAVRKVRLKLERQARDLERAEMAIHGQLKADDLADEGSV